MLVVRSLRPQVVVVGNFQLGKSTLVNCLLGEAKAEMGRGTTTTHVSTRYPLNESIDIVDTPGFDAPGADGQKDAEEAECAIKSAFMVIVVQANTSMDSRCRDVIRKALEYGKRCFFVFNCMRSNPVPEDNDLIVETITAELKNSGLDTAFLSFDGKIVHPINALWGLYGLGLLTTDSDRRWIEGCARDDLGIENHDEGVLRAEVLRRSNLPLLLDYLRNLPMEFLKDILANPEREVALFVDRFVAEFENRMKARGNL